LPDIDIEKAIVNMREYQTMPRRLYKEKLEKNMVLERSTGKLYNFLVRF